MTCEATIPGTTPGVLSTVLVQGRESFRCGVMRGRTRATVRCERGSLEVR